MPLFKDYPQIEIDKGNTPFLESISSLLRWATRNLAEFRQAESYGRHAGLSPAEVVFIQQGYLVKSVIRLTNDLVDKTMVSPSVPPFVPLDAEPQLGLIRLLPSEPQFTDEEKEVLETALNQRKDFITEYVFSKLIDHETGGRLHGHIESLRKKLGLKERE